MVLPKCQDLCAHSNYKRGWFPGNHEVLRCKTVGIHCFFSKHVWMEADLICRPAKVYDPRHRILRWLHHRPARWWLHRRCYLTRHAKVLTSCLSALQSHGCNTMSKLVSQLTTVKVTAEGRCLCLWLTFGLINGIIVVCRWLNPSASNDTCSQV